MDDEYKIGLDISEENYRDLPYPSYSLLSDIAKNGGEIVNGRRNEDVNEMDGVMVGKLVDNLLTENKYPDNFYVVKKIPTGKAKDVLKDGIILGGQRMWMQICMITILPIIYNFRNLQ